ncbi:MAG: RHS repeat-associated core domain-containing protein [Nitritalea sp.]
MIVQERHYYPFGLKLSGLSYDYQGHDNRYLYNGKELLDDLNLNLYDFEARFYDPAIGRWNVVDPLADQREWVSPYNLVQNNPLNRIDPDGRLDWVANREGGVYWDENATSRQTQILMKLIWVNRGRG